MYQSLQVCRAAAAALVVLFHLGGTFAQDKYFGAKAFDIPFAWADAGVDFFFVLSGFLITVTHRQDFGHPEALSSYVFKRTLRIYPTYWLVCIAVCMAAVAFPSLRQAMPNDVLSLIKAFALVPQDPSVVGGTGAPILFVAWSLQYEMLFYIVIAAFIANRTIGVLVVMALTFVFLGCRVGRECGFPLSFVANNMMLLFAMGVGSAYLARSRLRLPRPRLVAMAALGGFACLGACETWLGREAWVIDRSLAYGMVSSVAIIALAQAEDLGQLMAKQRWLMLLGASSYALYLLHIPIISVLCKLFLHLGVSTPILLIAAYIGIFLACVVSALMFHVIIERRMLASLRSIWSSTLQQPHPSFSGSHLSNDGDALILRGTARRSDPRQTSHGSKVQSR